MNFKSSRILSWIFRHWSTILIAFILVGVFFYRYSFLKNKSNQDLLLKDSIYSKWEENPSDDETFHNLKELLKRNHELHNNYDSLIAQRLLEIEKIDEALDFSKLPINQLKEVSIEYADFVEISVLISQGDFKNALDKAYDLHSRLEEASYLKFCNLLRISLLEKKLKNQDQELAALKQLEVMLQKNHEISQGSSLKNYIFQRKKTLTP